MKLTQEEITAVLNGEVGRRMAARIAGLQADNDRMAMELARRPRVSSSSNRQWFGILVMLIVLGAGWPLAFVLYVQRYAFDIGALPYFLATLFYLWFIGMSAIGYIRGRRK